MITAGQAAILADIFANTEALDHITLRLDHATRSMVIAFEDVDDEDFRELSELESQRQSDPK